MVKRYLYQLLSRDDGVSWYHKMKDKVKKMIKCAKKFAEDCIVGNFTMDIIEEGIKVSINSNLMAGIFIFGNMQ